jgi:hypothetical protein
LAVYRQALGLAGDSPNHWATCACTFAVVIQFIHRYMQLGCCARDEIIQVSDQPVAPSVGMVVATGTFSPRATLAITCQEVPAWVSPTLNDWTSSR